MRFISTLLALLLFGSNVNAQYDCSTGRFVNKLFQVDTLKDVIYGSNINISGIRQDLLMDIYTPRGDTASQRPVLILAHGGTFIAGNKNVIDVMTLANEFASRGYVAISMNYRLGIDILAPGTLQEKFSAAYWRAMQDGRAAVRFIRKDRSGLNSLRTDTSNIFLGGVSAGAVLSLSVAFVDLISEIPLAIDTNTLGGIEGNSGNPGYSSGVKAVINVSGALPIGTYFINNNSGTPLLNIHGDRDGTVPYKCDSFYFVGFGVERLCGSYSIDSAAKSIGMPSELVTFRNEGHVPWLGTGFSFDPAKKHLFDSLEQSAETFLANILCRNLGLNTGRESSAINLSRVDGGIEIEFQTASGRGEFFVTDVSGRSVFRSTMNGESKYFIPLQHSGVYILRSHIDGEAKSCKFGFISQ